MFPEFTRFFDAHCWAKGPSQLTQKSLCHWIGVKPGLAGVTTMSAMLTNPLLIGFAFATRPIRLGGSHLRPC